VPRESAENGTVPDGGPLNLGKS